MLGHERGPSQIGAQQVVVSMLLVQPDSMGGWTLTGSTAAGGSEFLFGDPLLRSDLLGDVLSMASTGGMMLSGTFTQRSPQADVLSLFGVLDDVPLTRLD